jgi:hypothetical protein
MTRIAFALFFVVAGCKSGDKSSGAPSPTPTPSAAPVPAAEQAKEEAAAKPEVKDEAPEAANTLKAGAPIEKGWADGSPAEVVWKVDGATAVTLKAEAGKPEGKLLALHQGKQQHVTNFPCDVASDGAQASFALNGEGKVVFRAVNGPAGKKPGESSAFLLEWKPDKGTVFVARSWQGRGSEEPPAWTKI